ncbi:sigma 54-interacting transcriptional regulator [Priestia megaterium]|uniref:sigma 54-interacting transcriptional regulator n=1 Tax=Priestia megaterium TaxID=1404 RepID=UPI000F2BFC1B|nr:sigma 54-interacting transcriptional regulator [Priestia megaterium]RMA94091.1 PAS domain S-box-containing protein [Priestia megaterium]
MNRKREELTWMHEMMDGELKTIFDISYDAIYMSDGEGRTLKVSSGCEEIWGYKEKELIGRTIYELEKEGVYSPSVTRLVLEKKEKVSMIQVTKMGRRLKVIGAPIKNKQGNIIRVVNISKDITEAHFSLQGEKNFSPFDHHPHEQTEKLNKKKLQHVHMLSENEEMKKVMFRVERAALVESSVLICGESGVGKETIAYLIHELSTRSNGPFVAMRCGGISSSDIEKEMLGQGEDMGAIEKAEGGTIFLDEIDALPLSLQLKLSYFIEQQLKSSYRSTRFITGTSTDLTNDIKRGKFRKELYYQLSIIPIQIPSLRNRKEDIIPLAFHFLENLNFLHKAKKKLHPKLLKKLQNHYSWPGNVRELKTLVERLFVLTEGEWIQEEKLMNDILTSAKSEKKIEIHELMPLKDAIHLVEQELLRKAKKKYKSTTQIARALGVNQSTISRKLSRF